MILFISGGAFRSERVETKIFERNSTVQDVGPITYHIVTPFTSESHQECFPGAYITIRGSSYKLFTRKINWKISNTSKMSSTESRFLQTQCQVRRMEAPCNSKGNSMCEWLVLNTMTMVCRVIVLAGCCSHCCKCVRVSILILYFVVNGLNPRVSVVCVV